MAALALQDWMEPILHQVMVTAFFFIFVMTEAVFAGIGFPISTMRSAA